MSGAAVPAVRSGGGEVVRRHRLSTRLWHWINAGTLLVMLMSGLMIFNAHPRLYWGEYGANYDAPWLKISSARAAGKEFGYLQIGNARIETTGVLGLWEDQDGRMQRRAVPYWATIPSRYSLAGARIWHLAFAWVLAVGLLLYLLWSLVNRHIQRDIHITRAEWRPSHIWHDIEAHARLRFPTGPAALKYNVLQKLAYAGVLFGLLPLMILTGLAMSPGTDAWFPLAAEVFGGRQSARSVHFICAFLLVLFFLVHMAMVVLAGPLNEVRSMITGRYRLPAEKPAPAGQMPEQAV
ncbi:cytochrome b/b6 domain-containing protein [Novosphingobium mangrovi (ex Huang et al. 2023)]|uniref:Cytochrome b/b6 domain-containing protein n=1 Tax=Novosphingobium mangrovi (ex Huang et al. 2023) TaxID=2976432 RepID=A0ABT2I0N3_9SPHN|nr:cytochrome b/b6 domain-containing protein [Novosphingobium mangrovi (ex Huang et al. 2023)]MCT2398358.1 cytochrome b/b6 domain-containing protein [Novosphingobium mangrovi (ex Huang et al. 2023)]